MLSHDEYTKKVSQGLMQPLVFRGNGHAVVTKSVGFGWTAGKTQTKK
jgi:hypothetical protein